MSEELSEEEKDVKLMNIIQELSELGMKKEANQLFKKIAKKICFVSLPDWEYHQICETYPQVDLRDVVFCCSPSNPCPYRNSVLKKLGLSVADYIEIKKKYGEEIGTLLKLSLPTGH